VFAYLRPVPQLTPLLEALRDCRARVLLRASALPPAALAPYLRPGFEVVGQSLSFVQAAADCDVFLNYAPHSTVAECLVAGKPGVVMPDNQERILVATRMVQLGAGIALPGDGSANVGAALQQVLDDPTYRQAAERFSASVSHLDRSRIFPAILEDALSAIA